VKQNHNNSRESLGDFRSLVSNMKQEEVNLSVFRSSDVSRNFLFLIITYILAKKINCTVKNIFLRSWNTLLHF